jgi:hypothetical protein
MATQWYKQNKQERLSSVTGIPLSFQSAALTHVLAALAIDKRTEKEQLALVELMLWQRFKPNSKRTKGKTEELQRLRKQIVRDRWKKAVHSVIAKYHISDMVANRHMMSKALKTGALPSGIRAAWSHPHGIGEDGSRLKKSRSATSVRFEVGDEEAGKESTKQSTDQSERSTASRRLDLPAPYNPGRFTGLFVDLLRQAALELAGMCARPGHEGHRSTMQVA